MLFLRLTYPSTVLFLLREGLGKRALKSFWDDIVSPIHLPCPKRNQSLLLLSLIIFLTRSLRKTTEYFEKCFEQTSFSFLYCQMNE